MNRTFKNSRITDKFQTLETYHLLSIDKSGQSGGYSGLLFQNISSVKTPGSEDNKIVGHPGGPWSNITFDNVVLGGKKIKNVNDLGKVGENVTDFIFK